MLDHARIRSILPHRHPVLLVDRIEELEPFEHIVAVKAVTGSEPCYAGISESARSADVLWGYRGDLAYPWSLAIESFGQSGAVLWLESIRSEGRRLDGGSLIFAAARDVVFHRPAYPGDTLRHIAHIDQLVGENAFLYGRTYIGDELAAEYGSVIAVIRSSSALGNSDDRNQPPSSRSAVSAR